MWDNISWRTCGFFFKKNPLYVMVLALVLKPGKSLEFAKCIPGPGKGLKFSKICQKLTKRSGILTNHFEKCIKSKF